MDATTDFDKEQYACMCVCMRVCSIGVYKSFYDFASRYYEIDNLLAGSSATPL